MVQIVYVGTADEVEVPSGRMVVDGEERVLVAQRGVPVDVTDETAYGTPGPVDADGNQIGSGRAGLLEQTDAWQLAPKSKPAKPAAPVDPAPATQE